ncbi:MAG: transposase domain-containing protein [Deltaproteobacteria bacterium]|nr:transposase domain-containing protein [Deltaproteobacteria bacterium]
MPETLKFTDHIGTGLLAVACPRNIVDEVLEETGKCSQRERLLPATAVVCFIMALSLWREMPLD